MSVESVTLAGRTAAEARMLDRCTIRRHGRATFTAGTYNPDAGTTVYEGPCELQLSDALGDNTPIVGERQITVQRLTVKIPLAITAVRVGDVATIDTARLDPGIVDRRYRIVADHAKSFATARRLQAVEITDGTDE